MKPGSPEKWHQVVSADLDSVDNVYELMRVVLDTTCPDLELVQTVDGSRFVNGEPEVYVEILHEGTCAEGWGMDLARIARAMAYQHANYLETNREDGDLFAGICDGFMDEARSIVGSVPIVLVNNEETTAE
jgi:hypothetical protein